MGRCRTRQDKAKENKSRKRNESRFVVKAGYKGGTEKSRTYTETETNMLNQKTAL